MPDATGRTDRDFEKHCPQKGAVVLSEATLKALRRFFVELRKPNWIATFMWTEGTITNGGKTNDLGWVYGSGRILLKPSRNNTSPSLKGMKVFFDDQSRSPVDVFEGMMIDTDGKSFFLHRTLTLLDDDGLLHAKRLGRL